MKYIIILVMNALLCMGITQTSFGQDFWPTEGNDSANAINVWSFPSGSYLHICYTSGQGVYLKAGTQDDAPWYDWDLPPSGAQSTYIVYYDPQIGGYYTLYAHCNRGSTPTYFYLVFHQPTITTQPITICQGETYAVGSNNYDTTGTYVDTLQTVNGCDSIVTTNLTVNSATSSSQSISGCQGFSITVGSNTYSTTGTYTDTLQTVNGCDSIVTTDLTINQPTSSSQTLAECQGFSITVGSNTYTTTGTYTDVLVGSNGCDSTVTTNLTINQPSSSTVNASICQGDSAFIGGQWQATAGTYYDTLSNVSGCDSIITTNLTVNSASSSSQSLIECQGFSITIGSNTYSTTGAYTDTLQTVNGCDSIVTTDLTINQPTSSSQTLAECQGFSMTVGSNTYTTTGIYTDVLVSSNGCDSTVTTNLLIKQPSSNTINGWACNNFWFNGTTYTTSGTYYDTLVNAVGCDSIVTLNITINQPSSSTASASICQGDSTFIGGQYQSTAGTYYDTLQTVNGCDSIVTTILTINPLPAVDLGLDTVIINEGQTATLAATANNADAYLWSTGDTVTSIVADSTGWYFITVTNSCGSAIDSVYLDVITSISSLPFIVQYSVHICPNPTADFINISGHNLGIESIEIFSQDGRLMMRIIDKNPLKVINVSILSKGVYFIKIGTLNGPAKPIKFVKT